MVKKMFKKESIPQEYKIAMMMADKDLALAKANVATQELKIQNIVLEIHAEMGKSRKEYTLYLEDQDISMVNIEELKKYQEEEKNKEQESKKKKEEPEGEGEK